MKWMVLWLLIVLMWAGHMNAKHLCVDNIYYDGSSIQKFIQKRLNTEGTLFKTRATAWSLCVTHRLQAVARIERKNTEGYPYWFQNLKKKEWIRFFFQ